MIPIASSAGLAVWLIIAAIVAIGKLIGKTAASVKKPLNPPPIPGQRGSIRQTQPVRTPESEEERTRKFLEALGLPPSTLEPKPAQTTLRPTGAEVVRHAEPPVPPRHAPLQPPAMPSAARAAVEASRLERKRQAAEHRRAASHQEAYDGAIERVHFAELKTPNVPEFHTRSSDVSAIPFEAMNSVAGQLYIKEESVRMNEILQLARSPKALRQAIFLREILGPPRSLQSLGAASNFASL